MDMDKVVIRKAKASDAAALLDYLKIIGSESDNLTFDAKGLPFTVQDEEAYLKAKEASTNSTTLLALLDNEIVGCISVDTPARKRLCHRGEIAVSVCKRCWGTGVGSALFVAMLTWARAKDTGLRKLDLVVRSDNSRALALYHKFGFSEEGRISRLLCINGKFHDGITMGLEID